MKKTNPSKVIIIPQTPQNNREEVAPQENAPVEVPTSTQAPIQQQAEAEEAVEEEAE